jgi:hypothetical protein
MVWEQARVFSCRTQTFTECLHIWSLVHFPGDTPDKELLHRSEVARMLSGKGPLRSAVDASPVSRA